VQHFGDFYLTGRKIGGCRNRILAIKQGQLDTERKRSGSVLAQKDEYLKNLSKYEEEMEKLKIFVRQKEREFLTLEAGKEKVKSDYSMIESKVKWAEVEIKTLTNDIRSIEESINEKKARLEKFKQEKAKGDKEIAALYCEQMEMETAEAEKEIASEKTVAKNMDKSVASDKARAAAAYEKQSKTKMQNELNYDA
jgi:chromosome segregation ATPase